MLRSEGRYGARFVEPHKCVELLRETRAGVMTEQLALGTVDDSNEAFELLLRESPPQDLIFRELEQEPILAAVVHQSLITIPAGGKHPLDLHWTVPLGGGRNRPRMSAKADQHSALPEMFAAKLADIELFANGAHLGVTRVADVRVVRPDDRLRPIPVRFEDMDEGLEHMGVAQIPVQRRHNT